MAESWIPIFRVDDEDGPTSINFNATFRDEGRVPDPSRPSGTIIVITFKDPGEHGLGERKEVEAIDAVMDTLQPRLERETNSLYAGRLRGQGTARMWVYSDPDQRDLIERLAKEAYRGREVVVEHGDDPEWEMYRAMSPTAREERWIRDYQVVQELAKRGDPLTPKRDVRHFAYFPDSKAADRFVARVKPMGFAAEVRKSERSEERFPWNVCASRDDSVEHEIISQITGELVEIAEELGGEYDGWEAMLIQRDQPVAKRGFLGKWLFRK